MGAIGNRAAERVSGPHCLNLTEPDFQHRRQCADHYCTMFLFRQLFHKQPKSPTHVIIRVSSTHPPHSILILCTPRKQDEVLPPTHTHKSPEFPTPGRMKNVLFNLGVCASMHMNMNLFKELKVWRPVIHIAVQIILLYRTPQLWSSHSRGRPR